MSAGTTGSKSTRVRFMAVGLALALVSGLVMVYWGYQARQARARALREQRLAQRATEAATSEADRARLAREAERLRDRARVRQLYSEIEDLNQRGQKVIESSRKPFPGLDDKLHKTSGEHP